MRPRLRTLASSIGSPLLGAAYTLALVAYEHGGADLSFRSPSPALAWALPLGLALGGAAGALGKLRSTLRAEAEARWQRTTLLLLGSWHLGATLWTLSARPSLASPTWYARGGLLRLTQVLATDALGPRAIVALGAAATFAYALGGPSLFQIRLTRWLERARLERGSEPSPEPGANSNRSEHATPPLAARLTPRPFVALAAALGLAALALIVLARPSRPRPPSSRPNLVLIGFGSIGAAPLDAETTPALEALAREGVFFDQALVSTTDPAMARAAWLSGLEPYRLRASGWPEGGQEGGPEGTLPERLAKAGYRSAIVGDPRLAARFGVNAIGAPALERWPLALEPLRLLATKLAPPLGLDAPGRRDLDDASEGVDRALRFVDEADGPFALALFLPASRPPFAGACPRALAFADPSYRGRCKYRACDAGPGAPALDDDDRRQELALRRGALACDDAALGRLLEGLRARGLEATTLVAAFGEGGALGDQPALALDDRTLRVPLIVRRGGEFAPATRREPVRDIDLAPTIDNLLRLAQIDGSPAGASRGEQAFDAPPGRSLAGALRGEPAAEAHAFAEASPRSTGAEADALGRRWALSAGPHRLVARATRRGLAAELFDRVADPSQQRDRSAEAPALRDALRDELLSLVLRDRALMLRFGHVMRRPAPVASTNLPPAPAGEPRERQRSLLDALQEAEQQARAFDLPTGTALSTLAPDRRAPPHPARRRVTLGAAGGRAETRDAFVVSTPSALRLPLRPGPRARLRVAPAPLSPPEGPLRVEVRARRRGAAAELLDAFELGAAEASRWAEREIDLGRFAGLALELELRALSDAAEGPALAWGSPSLVEASTPELPYNLVLVAFQGAADPARAAPGVGGPAPDAASSSAAFARGPWASRVVTFPDFVPAATWREPALLALLSGMRSGELGLTVGAGSPSPAALDAFYARRPPLLALLLGRAGATTFALHEASAKAGGPLAIDLGFDSLVEIAPPPARAGPAAPPTSAAEFGAWLERHGRERFFALALLDADRTGGPRQALDALLAPLQRLELERETIVAIAATGGPRGLAPDAPDRFLASPPPLVVIAPGAAASVRAEAPAHGTDLAPTLLALEGLAVDPRVSGRPLLDARQAPVPSDALAARARVTEGRGGRSLRSGPWLYVERDPAGTTGQARSFLFDARDPRPRNVADAQPATFERARDELARALSLDRSAEARQSDALAGSRFEPPPPSPRALVRLRFYGGSARHRVALRIEKPTQGPGEAPPALRVTPVGLDPGVLYEGASFVDAAFFTEPDRAPGFDLELAPSTTPLPWQLSWNDRPLEGLRWFAGPHGLSLPSLRGGLLDEGTRRFAEARDAPADLSPARDEGVLVLWSELPDPP